MDVHETQLSSVNLSEEQQYPGLDLQAAQTWIYPTNYPVREYQLNIVQNALFKNTLVSLPTGLGKTFIAAVVMYNFYRWYPSGKIVFMAPTRPLVKQQVDACYDIMAIPKNVTVELTGTNVSASREDIWKEKRVFFITPQILQNDLERISDMGQKIRCLVFDEAHKARGKHAYCEVIKKLKTNKYFRVLALSATPGASITDVMEVIDNLLISHLEFRTEDNMDVKPYVFQRNITTVVVPLGEKLQQIKDVYLQVLEYHTRTLIKYKVIQGNLGSLTKGKIFITMKNFQHNCRGSGTPNYAEVMKCLNICVTLYHAFELLIRHGMRSFLTFFEEHIDKPLLRGNSKIINIMEDIRNHLGPPLNLERLPDGEYTKVSQNVKFGHPKFYKLMEILLTHFQENCDSSRVIVFFEYRDSVMEAFALLGQHYPVIKPRIFLGQKNGITQKSQINVVKAFREGSCNTLLSTSIGEEGLDVGEVDLIICFDISNKSPIRMVQRMGRTGRKKEGSVIVLVTEGKEQQTLKDCLIHKNNITQHVLSSKEIAKCLCTDCPRMLPDSILPKCEKMFITVEKIIPKKKTTLKDLFRSVSSTSDSISLSPDSETIEFIDIIPETTWMWNKVNPLDHNIELSTIYNKKIQKQRVLQESHMVKHSKDCEMMVNLLQFVDSKRYNLPLTQIGETLSGASVQRNYKQTDIRNMFMKSQNLNDFATLSTNEAQQLLQPPSEKKSDLKYKPLFEEISDYLSLKMCDRRKKCRYCPEYASCENIKITEKDSISINWTELDETVYTSITVQDIKVFKTLLDKCENTFEDLFEEEINFENIPVPSQVSNTPPVLELDDLIDKSILEDFFNKSANFQAPKSFAKVVNKLDDSISQRIKNEKQDICVSQKKNSETNYAMSYKDVSSDINEKLLNDILEFFKLDSLDDIYHKEIINLQDTVIYSPDIFDQTFQQNKNDKVNECYISPVSPVLVKYSKKSSEERPNLKRLKSYTANIASPSKFSLNKTKVSSTPQILSQNLMNTKTQRLDDSTVKNIPKTLELKDLCDMTTFGLDVGKVAENKTSFPHVKTLCTYSPSSISDIARVSDSFNLEDFCELADLTNVNTQKINSREENQTSNHEKIISKNTKCSSSSLDKNVDFCGVNATEVLSPEMKITQMISFINKPSQNLRSIKKSCHEEGTEDFIDDDFNFSFNEKKTPKKKRKHDKSCIKSPQKLTTQTTTPKKGNNPLISSSNYLLNSKLDNEYVSDDDFEPKHNRTPTEKNKSLKKKIPSKTTKKAANDFLDNEAELSLCNSVVISDDEDETDIEQGYDSSFITDETLQVDTQMHLKYMQSVRSPVINNKGFKIPTRRNFSNNVYSQEVNNADDTYLDDSFVVQDENVTINGEYSQLELLEMKLEERKRKNKTKSGIPLKRRRIIECCDSD